MAVVTLAELLEAGVHFGHQARRWNPKMFPYIYAERNGIHIIDLVQTSQLLTNACEFVRKASQEGKRFFFVGTKRQAASVICQEAERCGAYYINQRWLGGILTNWFTIKTRVERLKDLEQKEESGYLDQLPKKEAASIRRELEKLRKNLNGIKNMKRLPDLVVIVDQKRESTAIQECIKLKIPVISILDTNCDPDLTDIPIPANDDAIRSIKLILGKLSESIYEGNNGNFKNDDGLVQSQSV
uniref:Small ribosomal subunit protein uS2c n=1 Tax=Cryptomonas curvata TaxID=233186 RepID=A0A222AHD1_9CRYP|nr:ribosomal protein S2 [Cryptomonas curvata]ASO75780.1 ribosomal protein S2 [Cryptomonas curvata]